jgi:hypothetical protein
MITPKCKTESKQQRCFTKWEKKKQESPFVKDEQWEETRRIIWNRDAGIDPPKKGFIGKEWWKYCRLARILFSHEIQRIFLIDPDLLFHNQRLDVAHIRPKSVDKSLYYDPDNLLLIARGFHGRLDRYRHPVTNAAIKQEEKHKWMEMIKANHRDPSVQ